MRALCLVLAAVMGACAQPGLRPDAPPVPFTVLPPSVWGCGFTLQQKLTTVRDGDERTVVALVEADPRRFRMVGLSPLGPRLFEVLQPAQGAPTLESLLPIPEGGRDPLRVLRDFQLAYAPEAALRAALAPGWQLHTPNPGRRELLHHGTLAAWVERPAAPKIAGEMRLSNQVPAYTLAAQTMSFQPAAADTAGCVPIPND